MPTVGFQTPFAGAVWCIEKGFRLFPLRKGSLDEQKQPAVQEWERKATCTPDAISKWEADHPNANWGLACGPSGLLVVDLDDKGGKHGTEEWRKLCAANDYKPDTLVVRSASRKSWHLYFVGEGGNSASKLGPGIDTRGAGGYVVAPGAAFVAPGGEVLGRYEIEIDAPVAPAPAWLLQLVALRKAPAAPVGTVIPEGQRDSTLTSLAGSMRNRGFEYDEILAALTVANRRRCNPPIGEESLSRISRSVCRYEPGRSERDIAAMQALDSATSSLVTEKLPCASSLKIEDIPLRDWVVPGRYLRGAMSLTVGPGGASKSSLALLEAVAVASGKSGLADLPYAMTPKRVFYFNAEDTQDEINRRLAGIVLRHNLRLADLDGLFCLSGVSSPLRLAGTDTHGLVHLSEAALGWLQNTVRENRIDLVILDPWAGLHTCPENDNVAMDQLARGLIKAMSDAGAALHIVHHSRKLGVNDGAGDAEISRGASSLVAAARYAATLRGMDKTDAEELGISDEARHQYCRRDDAKANYIPAATVAKWFFRESILLPHYSIDAPAQSVAVLVPIDAAQMAAEESQYRAVLSSIMPRLLGTDEAITLHDLATRITKTSEDKDRMGGGSVASIRRRLECVLATALVLDTGKEIGLRGIRGHKWAVIKQEEFLA